MPLIQLFHRLPGRITTSKSILEVVRLITDIIKADALEAGLVLENVIMRTSLMNVPMTVDFTDVKQTCFNEDMIPAFMDLIMACANTDPTFGEEWLASNSCSWLFDYLLLDKSCGNCVAGIFMCNTLRQLTEDQPLWRKQYLTQFVAKFDYGQFFELHFAHLLLALVRDEDIGDLMSPNFVHKCAYVLNQLVSDRADESSTVPLQMVIDVAAVIVKILQYCQFELVTRDHTNRLHMIVALTRQTANVPESIMQVLETAL